MSRQVCAALLVVSALGCGVLGCGAEYRCPDPIGPIIRDDCDAYVTRYDALKVDLSVTFAGLGVGARVGDEAIREPSELIQVLRLQTEALCRDHNACRLAPADYQRRREALDSRYSAITGLSSAIREAGDAATRRQLADQLVVLLQAPLGEAAPPDPVGPKVQRDPFRNATMTWLGSQLGPARPVGPPGVPALAGWSVQASGQRHYLHLRLWGPVARDDFAYVSLPGQAPVRCPVTVAPAKAERGQGGAGRCVLDGPWPEAGALRFEYTPGLTGVRAPLGQAPLAAADRQAPAWLALLPHPVQRDPVTHERLWLVLYRPDRPAANVTARCARGEAPVGAVIRGDAAPREADGLYRYHLPLPVALPRTAPAPPADADLLTPEAARGDWACTVSVTGRPVRTLRFTLGADGRPVAPRAPADLIAPPWWQIDGP